MHSGVALWRVDIATYCSWLPGDVRGFRNREHRIHSSGDYKNRPPIREHEGLRRYNEPLKSAVVIIPRAVRLLVAQTIARALLDAGQDVRVVSAADRHAHVLARLPLDLREFNRLIGRAKAHSSLTIRAVLPGQVWSRGDKHDTLRDASHQKNAYDYVRDKQGPRAAVWCHDGLRREAELE